MTTLLQYSSIPAFKDWTLVLGLGNLNKHPRGWIPGQVDIGYDSIYLISRSLGVSIFRWARVYSRIECIFSDVTFWTMSKIQREMEGKVGGTYR